LRFAGIFASETVERQFIRDDLRQAMAERGEYVPHQFAAGFPAPAQLGELLTEADVALTTWDSPRLPLGVLSQRPRRLKYVCNLSGAVRSWIPREYIEDGILVTNWGDGPVWYLAEGTLTLILACTREMSRLPRHMREQPTWTYPYCSPAPTLRGKIVGLIGLGATGRAMLGLLKPFECHMICYDPYARELPVRVSRCATLEELFEQSDVVSVHCGLTEETTGMIGRAQLDRLRPHAIFINTARGKIVREQELIEFLCSRPDVYAGLDVYEQEPLSKDSALLSLDNAICYPHSIGSGGDELFRSASACAARNIRAFCAGRPLAALITLERYDRMT